MVCFSPLKGYRAAIPNENGKRPIVFKPANGFVDLPVELPCGQCIGCRLERSRQWAMRCVHEASLYENNCFVTLTYDDDHLPVGGSLVKADFQKFMKRLRKKFGEGVRYYHCGEYGEKNRRPHYHACIFNHDFDDKVLFSVRDGINLYISSVLDSLWARGFATVGDVTFESAAYCARYIMKKVNGDAAAAHYTVVDPDTGEVTELQPEYTTMSRRPGIGVGWLSKFKSDVYPQDEVVLRGRRMKPPKYYDRVYEHEDPEGYLKLRGARVRQAEKHADNNSPERLKVREKVQRARVKMLKRSVE